MKNILKYLYNEVEYLIFSTLMVIIIFPKPVQLFFYLAILFVMAYKNRFEIRLNAVSIAMIALFAVHAFAIIFNIIFIGSSWNRVFAAVNTAMLWPISALYYSIYLDKNKEIDLCKIGKYCFVNIILLFAMAIVAVFLYCFRDDFSIGIGKKLLYTTTYLNNVPKIKFVGLNDFSNMNLICIMIMSLFSFYYVKDKGIIIKLLCLIMVAFEAYLIHSRSGMILFTICLFASLIVYIKPKHQMIIVCTVVLLGVIVVLINHNLIYQLFKEKILYGNESSTNFRKILMGTSVDEVMTKSPIWGMGVKRYLYEGYPLGSHSTYIGFLYKTGIIGAILGGFIFVKANYDAVKKSKSNMVFLYLICLLIMFVIEDVDGANWCIVIYFSSLAMFGMTKGDKVKSKHNV